MAGYLWITNEEKSFLKISSWTIYNIKNVFRGCFVCGGGIQCI